MVWRLSESIDDIGSSSPEGAVHGRSTRSHWVVGCLFAIWACCYLTRDHLIVASSDFKSAQKLSDAQYGSIFTLGYALYLVGKISFGVFADRFTGKIALLITIIGSSLLSLLLSVRVVSNPQYYAIIWAAIKFTQAAGWVGIVSIIGNWIHYENHGKAMSVMSLSFLVGDAFMRSILAGVISPLVDHNWSSVVRVAAFLQLALILPLCTINSSPKVPLPPNPNSVYGTDGGNGSIIWPLLKSKSFWLNCALSFQISSIRETFNVFSVEYLQTIGASESLSGTFSSLFPLFGIPSVILLGVLVDKFEKVELAQSSRWHHVRIPCISCSHFSCYGVDGG